MRKAPLLATLVTAASMAFSGAQAAEIKRSPINLDRVLAAAKNSCRQTNDAFARTAEYDCNGIRLTIEADANYIHAKIEGCRASTHGKSGIVYVSDMCYREFRRVLDTGSTQVVAQ